MRLARSPRRWPEVVSDFVLDVSITAAWLFTDEASSASKALLRRLLQTKAVVPRLWHLETGNMLLVAERRGRITAGEVERIVDDLARLPIETDSEAGREHQAILRLARQHRLTTYDAAYLDLAIRRRLPLATRDKDLQRAAKSAKIAVLEG